MPEFESNFNLWHYFIPSLFADFRDDSSIPWQEGLYLSKL